MNEVNAPRRVLIVAIDACGGISRAGDIPWKLPEDMAHFRMQTYGHPVIMGRKTYETIGKPLAGRTTIVISSDPFFRNDRSGRLDRWLRAGSLVPVPSVEAAFDLVKDDPLVFLAGGLSIYEQGMKYCNEMVVTTIKKDFHCHQFFTAQMDKWRVANWDGYTSEKSGLDYMITKFERVAPDDDVTTKKGGDNNDEQIEDTDAPDDKSNQ